MRRFLVRRSVAVCLLLLGLNTSGHPTDLDSASQSRAPARAEPPARPEDSVLADPIEITAEGSDDAAPRSLAAERLDYRDAIAAPIDVQDWLAQSPGVAATGQNGLFETFSIRGQGGNAILARIGGMPITAQRRAGVPLSFVEPLLLGDVTVVRGPAVAHYGPGALGGAVSIEPRWFDRSFGVAAYASGGDERLLLAATGNDALSLAVARHAAGDSQAPDGQPLNTHYQRESAVLQYRTRIEDFDLDALWLPSRSTDIGKSSSRFPARITTYPLDRHQLGRLRLHHTSGLELSLHLHQQRLDTHNQRQVAPDAFASIESTDLGWTLQRRVSADSFDYRVGIEYLGRRDVNGFDARGSRGNRTYSLEDARESNGSLFALADWQLAQALALEFGLRATRLEQAQQGAEADDGDAAFSLGAVWSPDPSARWTLNLASGYRFATLEERYYSGVTAQGEIVGNSNLSAEQALGLDLGYAWTAGAWTGALHVWCSRVDDLIELTRLDGGLDSYVNIGRARLYGAEAEIDYRFSQAWQLRATAAYARGQNALSGAALSGIGPPDLALEARYAGDRYDFGLRYGHRGPKRRPGFDELQRSAVDSLDLDFGVRLRRGLRLQIHLRNALDRRYFATADQLSALAPERSLGANLIWSAE